MYKPEKMNDKDNEILPSLEGNGSSTSGCMLDSAGEKLGEELEEGEISVQGSDSGNARTSEGNQITGSTSGLRGCSSPSRPILHEGGSSSTNQGDLESCQEIDIKILCSEATPAQSSSPSYQQIARKVYACATGCSAGPAESSNELNSTYNLAALQSMKQQREDKNEVQMERRQLEHVDPRAAGEPRGDVVCRNSRAFDLNLLPDMDEDEDLTSTKDDHPGGVRESSTNTATKHLLQTPNRVSAFSPYVSSSRSSMSGVQKPAHLDSQTFRIHHLAMAPPHTQALGAPRSRPPLPSGLVPSMNPAPLVCRSMVAAVGLTPCDNHGRRRLVAAAAAGGPPTLGPPFMARARAPRMVYPPAHLYVNYSTQHPQMMQQEKEEEEEGTPSVQQKTLQLFPRT